MYSSEPTVLSTVLKPLGQPRYAAAIIFAVALFSRVVFLAQLSGSPYAAHHLVDAQLYDEWAGGLARGAAPYTAPYFYSPVYPYAVSLIYKLLGHAPAAVRLVQCLLGSCSCLLVYLLARRLLSNSAAFAAGLFCALYGPLLSLIHI